MIRKGSSAELGICPTCGEATEWGGATCGDPQCEAEQVGSKVAVHPLRAELFAYANARRKWWLIPIIGLLAMLRRPSRP